MRPIVVLIGPPGAGKSQVGRKLAKYLGAEFIDTDSRIVLEHGPIAEIFQTRGEPAFRAIEREVVAEALTHPAVVSLGGGAVMDTRTDRALQGLRVALLTVSPEAVATRLTGRHRPLLEGGSPDDRLANWLRIAESRRRTYEALATRSWDTSLLSVTQVAREIADWTQEDMAGTTN